MISRWIALFVLLACTPVFAGQGMGPGPGISRAAGPPPSGADFESDLGGWAFEPEPLPVGWTPSVNPTGARVNNNADTGSWAYQINNGSALDDLDELQVLPGGLYKTVTHGTGNVSARVKTSIGTGVVFIYINGVFVTDSSQNTSTAYATYSWPVSAGTNRIAIYAYGVSGATYIDNIVVP